MFLFPNFQYASLFLESLERCSPAKKVALYTTFFLPLISFLTFVKPVKTHIIMSTRMTDDFYETFRILIIILWAAMRCATAKIHLQTFLDMPKAKIIELTQNSQMKEEERQRKVAHYASYSCVSLLQYFVPVLITLAVALLLKSLGDIKVGSLMNMKNPLQSDQQNSGKDYGALQPFLDKEIQKAFWTLLTTLCVGINSVLCVCGVIFKRTLLSRP
uniref:Uncharacterized protein n=1 Tax=Ditylenchus dipsaci TaxID=166011 RepID=A0A915E2C6_9BILA